MSVITPLTRRRLLEVAVAIQKHTLNGLGFNMSWWIRDEGAIDVGGNPNFCGTVACIAGHAAVLANVAAMPDATLDEVVNETAISFSCDIRLDAATWLGIEAADAEALFNGLRRDYDRFWSLDELPAEQAIATLCAFAGTGYVDWKASPAQWGDPAAALAALGDGGAADGQ